MKTLYIDCSMGAAGDMLTAALMDCLSSEEKESILNKINNLGLDGVDVNLTTKVKQGITGSHITVKVNGEEEESVDYHHDHEHHHDHHHASLSEVMDIIDGLNIEEKIKENVKKVYITIAEAEGHVHGKDVGEVHFHEVGSKDAIVDITSVCLLLDYIKPDKILASPVHVGAGKVKCAHGIMPVPAPATAHILKGIPVYGGKIQGELCTPTGAAILKAFVNEFGDMPVMNVDSIGYGMGNKDFEVVNCLRVMVGQTANSQDRIVELNCNVDDMTGEQLGFAMENIMKAGARDVFITPTVMKKSRPGHVISVICTPDDKMKMVEAIMKYTSTIGIREKICDRYVLQRSMEEVNTPYGPVNKKISTGYGTRREKLEYEDIAKIARENGLSLTELANMILKEAK